MSDKKMHDGFWNGEPAKFRVVNIVVGQEPKQNRDHFEKHYPGQKRYMWFVPFIGQTFQAIEITYQGEIWYIDNSNGTGLYKVTKGMGSPSCGHASIYPQTVLDEVHPKDWIDSISKEFADNREKEIGEFWMSIDPENYRKHLEKMKALKEMINKSRKELYGS